MNKYIRDMGLTPSGITNIKKNYPDKRYLILVIATLSRGQDEIFDPNYIPKASERKQAPAQQFNIANDDGVFTNIPDHLKSKKPGKGFKMTTVTKADKLEAHLIIAQERLNKQQEIFARRQKELADHKCGKDKLQRERE
jgi:hypothetical protein